MPAAPFADLYAQTWDLWHEGKRDEAMAMHSKTLLILTEMLSHGPESLKYILLAVSWGGYESLIMPACTFKQPCEPPFNFIRFYIGLEETEVLIEDLRQALENIEN